MILSNKHCHRIVLMKRRDEEESREKIGFFVSSVVLGRDAPLFAQRSAFRLLCSLFIDLDHFPIEFVRHFPFTFAFGRLNGIDKDHYPGTRRGEERRNDKSLRDVVTHSFTSIDAVDEKKSVVPPRRNITPIRTRTEKKKTSLVTRMSNHSVD